MVFSLGKFKEKTFRVVSVVVLMGMVICSGTGKIGVVCASDRSNNSSHFKTL